MITDAIDQINNLKHKLTDLSKNLNLDQKKANVLDLEKQTSDPNFWKDDQKAKNIMQKLSHFKDEIDQIEKLNISLNELRELIELSQEEESDTLDKDINAQLKEISKKISALEINSYYSGEYDNGPAILSIHSGQGGTEAMDWAEMLLRMYIKYCESHDDFSYKLIEETRGEEAGIKSATIFIEGPYAFGSLKKEAGTHRLVRLSPFNADNLRQTSFALVEVLPHISDSDNQIEVRDEDVEWQFFRSGGKGGQNVNKVSTAVRLKHIPSGIVVESQAERHQEQNRKIAMSILQGKLWNLQEIKKEEELNKLKGQKIASWGTQIRSYVLHPYKMVKDLRTQMETSDSQGFLDGKIDDFIAAQAKL